MHALVPCCGLLPPALLLRRERLCLGLRGHRCCLRGVGLFFCLGQRCLELRCLCVHADRHMSSALEDNSLHINRHTRHTTCCAAAVAALNASPCTVCSCSCSNADAASAAAARCAASSRAASSAAWVADDAAPAASCCVCVHTCVKPNMRRVGGGQWDATSQPAHQPTASIAAAPGAAHCHAASSCRCTQPSCHPSAHAVHCCDDDTMLMSYEPPTSKQP